MQSNQLTAKRKSLVQIFTFNSDKGRKLFALRIIRLAKSLPNTREAEVIARQVLRSGTAGAANYRAAGRSRSRVEFVSKIRVAVEEADETAFWLELLIEAELISKQRLAPLSQQANELLAIMSASRMTAKQNGRYT
jgi:four helix bundle protein